MANVQIFLSAVSAEFKSYRDNLRRDLDLPDVTVKVQEDFIATGTETLDKLDEYIRQCDAVIHLVGNMTGAMTQSPSLAVIRQRYPDITERFRVLEPFFKPDATALSYTQWEAWLALYHRKVLLIAVPESNAPRDTHCRLDDTQLAAQNAHLVRLAGVERYPEIHFADAGRLAVEVLRSRLRSILDRAGAVPALAGRLPAKSYLLVANVGPFLPKLRSSLLNRTDLNIVSDKNPASSSQFYKQYLEIFLHDTQTNWLLTNFPSDLESVGFDPEEYLRDLVRGNKRVIFFDSGFEFHDAWSKLHQATERPPFFVIHPTYELAAKELLLKLESALDEKTDHVVFCLLFPPDSPSANIRREIYQAFLADVVYRHQWRSGQPPGDVSEDHVELLRRRSNTEKVNGELARLAGSLAARNIHVVQWRLDKPIENARDWDEAHTPTIRQCLSSMTSSLRGSSVVFLCANDQIARAVDRELWRLGELCDVSVTLLGFDGTEPIWETERRWRLVCTADVDFDLMCHEAAHIIDLDGEGMSWNRPIETPVRTLSKPCA